MAPYAYLCEPRAAGREKHQRHSPVVLILIMSWLAAVQLCLHLPASLTRLDQHASLVRELSLPVHGIIPLLEDPG